MIGLSKSCTFFICLKRKEKIIAFWPGCLLEMKINVTCRNIFKHKYGKIIKRKYEYILFALFASAISLGNAEALKH